MNKITFRVGKALMLTFILNLLFGVSAFSQLQEPVKWTFKANRINDTIAELQFITKIDATWHLYSQKLPPDGPLPTVFKFDKNNGFQLIGKVAESKSFEEYDEMFEMKVSYFAMQAVFVQKVKIQSNQSVKITGEIDYQACDNKSCISDTKVFSFDLAGSKTYTAPVASNKADAAQVNIPDTVTTAQADSTATTAVVDTSKPIDDGKTPLWLFFILAFGAGLIAILTPCVFPMIPMTVSYFMKSGSNGKIQASIYGFSIIAIYTLFGTLVAVLFGAEFSNWISTHWIPNVLFFLIFVIFGASFFGYFEITMPNWLVNKSVSAEDKGGTIGTVFMAFTLVLVSFSCTGPIVGTILVESVGGQILKPVIGMLGFSLAFAIPFTLFALFPQWLNKLPKSGGWLNTVKVVLGFIELAFALKFLNIPDQTYHWGILDREIYLGFWIVIFTMMGFYLLGKIKFPHDSDYPVVKSFPRLMLIIATFTFVIYLIPGLWGAPLKGISGWLPPMETQDFDVTAIVRDNSGSGGSEIKGNIAETPKYLNTALKLPHGLKGYFDYDEALKASKVLNKPVFVDFTGHGCTNCREMENRVWSDPEVLKRLRENFVIAALYVDDKVIEMPKEQWYTNKSGREVKLLGKKNAEIQIDKFKQNAQPFYVILDGDGNSLVTPHAYDLDIASYIKFLDEGVAAYNKKNGIK
ncbi:MAG: cytochrome c biogenesis protein CcdA [Bacteroidales bacterium]|nr:cytochrome c biogenesis protein CcdA [Bacteroidales bacterium]